VREGAYQGDYRYAPADASGDTARWEQGLQPGLYEVFVSYYYPFSNWVSDAPYQVYDGATLEEEVSVNQRLPLDDAQSPDGQWWERLGEYAITSGTLAVEVRDEGTGNYVCADAIWIRYIGEVSASAASTATAETLDVDTALRLSEFDMSLLAYEFARKQGTSARNDSADSKEEASDFLFADALWLDN